MAHLGHKFPFGFDGPIGVGLGPPQGILDLLYELMSLTDPAKPPRWRCGATATTDALAQRVHQIPTTFSPRRTLLRNDGFAGALLVDQVDQGGFVLVFELVRLEVAPSSGSRCA